MNADRAREVLEALNKPEWVTAENLNLLQKKSEGMVDVIISKLNEFNLINESILSGILGISYSDEFTLYDLVNEIDRSGKMDRLTQEGINNLVNQKGSLLSIHMIYSELPDELKNADTFLSLVENVGANHLLSDTLRKWKEPITQEVFDVFLKSGNNAEFIRKAVLIISEIDFPAEALTSDKIIELVLQQPQYAQVIAESWQKMSKELSDLFTEENIIKLAQPAVAENALKVVEAIFGARIRQLSSPELESFMFENPNKAEIISDCIFELNAEDFFDNDRKYQNLEKLCQCFKDLSVQDANSFSTGILRLFDNVILDDHYFELLFKHAAQAEDLSTAMVCLSDNDMLDSINLRKVVKHMENINSISTVLNQLANADPSLLTRKNFQKIMAYTGSMPELAHNLTHKNYDSLEKDTRTFVDLNETVLSDLFKNLDIKERAFLHKTARLISKTELPKELGLKIATMYSPHGRERSHAKQVEKYFSNPTTPSAESSAAQENKEEKSSENRPKRR